MPIRKSSVSGSGGNDFVLSVGSSGDTTYILDRTYTSGRYIIDFVNNDATYDIYAIAGDGTYAGYSNTNTIEITENFTEIVVLGADNGETVLFTYEGTLTSPSSIGDVTTAGAFINSVVTSALPDINDTTVVNGGNFAADVAVSFIGQNTAEATAKSVVRSSSTELVATRPDDFDPENSPYTVKVVNPGIPVPSGTNAHLLSNAVTAGTNPVWQTPTDIFYNVGAATSITLLATDTEASDVDYSLISGTLPDGLALDNETGVISGTATGTPSEGDVTAVTFRATDAGGNFLDKAFNLTANTAPTWTTQDSDIETVTLDQAVSFQFAANGGSAGGSLTYSVQSGSLPTGTSLNSAGLLTGTPTVEETVTFTLRVTDQGGLFADRQFTVVVQAISSWITTFDDPTIAGGYLRGVSTPDANGNFLTIVKDEVAGNSPLETISQLVSNTGTIVNDYSFGSTNFDDYGTWLSLSNNGTVLQQNSPFDSYYKAHLAIWELSNFSKSWEVQYRSTNSGETIFKRSTFSNDANQSLVFASGHTYSNVTGAIFVAVSNLSGSPVWNRGLAGGQPFDSYVTSNKNNDLLYMIYDDNTSKGIPGALVGAISPSGNHVWNREFTDPNNSALRVYDVASNSKDGSTRNDFVICGRNDNYTPDRPFFQPMDALTGSVSTNSRTFFPTNSTNTSVIPRGVAVDDEGNVYLSIIGSPYTTSSIIKTAANGALLWSRKFNFSGNGNYFYPWSMHIDPVTQNPVLGVMYQTSSGQYNGGAMMISADGSLGSTTESFTLNDSEGTVVEVSPGDWGVTYQLLDTAVTGNSFSNGIDLLSSTGTSALNMGNTAYNGQTTTLG